MARYYSITTFQGPLMVEKDSVLSIECVEKGVRYTIELFNGRGYDVDLETARTVAGKDKDLVSALAQKP